MAKSLYETLEINENAAADEIKKAYRKLSLKFHPDKNDGDEFFTDRFKEIQEAYEALINGQRNHSQQSNQSNTNNSYDRMINSIINLIQESKWRQAIKLADDAIKLDPESSNAYTYKSLAHFSVNEYFDAELNSARAMARGGMDSSTLYVHGQSLVALEKYNAAVQTLTKYLELHDEDSDIVGSLALSYEKLGNKDKGKYYWDRLAYLDPNNQMLKARKNVWNTGNGNYVSKQDGKNAACFICILLECIFDCL